MAKLYEIHKKWYQQVSLGVKVRTFGPNVRAPWPQGAFPKRIWKDVGKRAVASLRFGELFGATWWIWCAMLAPTTF